MAYYSLIHKNNPTTIQQIVSSLDETFEVHSDLKWVKGPPEMEEGDTAADFEFVDGIVQLKSTPPTYYEIERRYDYPSIGDQLDILWHDMNSGKIPGKEDSVWFNEISKVKEKHPKT